MDMSSVKKFFTPQRKRFVIIIITVIAIWVTMDLISFATPGLKNFSFPEAGFSMKFFHEPNTNEARFEFKDTIIKGTNYMTRGGSLSLILVYFDLPDEILTENSFNDIVDSFVQEQLSSIKSDSSIHKEDLYLGNFAAKKVQLTIKDDLLTQHFYLYKNRFFNAIAASRPSPFGVNQDAMDEFLNSFQIIE